MTLKDAAFTALALDPGQPRTLAFLHRARKLAGTVKLSGSEVQPLVVKLGPCGVLTGRVVGADGKPIAGAEVVHYYEVRHLMALMGGSRQAAAVADREGQFRVTEIVPGQPFHVGFRVRGRFLESKTLREKTVTVAAGAKKNLGDVKSVPFGE